LPTERCSQPCLTTSPPVRACKKTSQKKHIVPIWVIHKK
jgi:hypothetical protein